MVVGIYTGRWIIPSVDSEVRHEYSSEQRPLLRPMTRIVWASPLKSIILSKDHRSTFALLVVCQRLGDFLFFHKIAEPPHPATHTNVRDGIHASENAPNCAFGASTALTLHCELAKRPS